MDRWTDRQIGGETDKWRDRESDVIKSTGCLSSKPGSGIFMSV